jgi:nitrogen PTS system EIIA component
LAVSLVETDRLEKVALVFAERNPEMQPETMDLQGAAEFLSRDVRDVARMASRGYLPARRVGDGWRFSRTEVTQWVEKQMHAFTEQELAGLEGNAKGVDDLLLAQHLPPDCVAVPLKARTKQSALKELLETAERSWQVYDPATLLQALQQREELGSTALENGVALPHPHRPLPEAVGDTVIAYGRSFGGLPFGGPRGVMTDVFFLVLAHDARTHLQVLARLSRILMRPGLLDELRSLETPEASHQLLLAAERDLTGQ